MRLDDVQRLLEKQCARAGSLRKFAAAHGIHVQYISQVLHGKRPPSERLCQALNIRSDGERWVKT